MSNSVKFGLISGALLSVYSIILFVSNSSLRFSANAGWLVSMAVPFVFMIIAIRAEKKEQNGLIGFGEALKTAFIVFLISVVVSTIVTAVLFRFYSDADWQAILDNQLEIQRSIMAAAGADEVLIEENLEKITLEGLKEQMANPFFLLIGVLTNCFVGLILALIPAAIMKNSSN